MTRLLHTLSPSRHDIKAIRDPHRLILLSAFALAAVVRTHLSLGHLSKSTPAGNNLEAISPEVFSSVDHFAGQSCSIYLAPSSVADGNNRPAGFGIFTTRPMSKGAYIFPRGTGPVVPITDLKANNDGNKPSFANSIFMPRCSGMGIESDQGRDSPYPRYIGKVCYKSNNNCGSLTNYHPMLLNLGVDDTDRYQDNILSRSSDPGAGAFSYQIGEKWHTTRHVEAGEELFNDYGEKWFLHGILNGRDTIPHKENYVEAAKIMEMFSKSYKDKIIGQTELDEFHEEVARADVVDNLTKRLIDLATPDSNTYSKFIESTETYATGSTDYSRQWRLARSLGLQSTIHRDVDWIKKNGRCLDNVYPKLSTLPQAGQGGFATRRLEKGQVIVPVPTMVQVTDRKELNVYTNQYINGEAFIGTKPYTKQLLINYCFGHDGSSMLLCPATNANLINHCSTTPAEGKIGHCDPTKGPNAILRWATEFDPETSEWLSQDLDTIKERIKDGRRGLSLEIIALRDINVNEEVFIDYGPSWEDAWKRHVATWKPPIDNDGIRFVPVSDMNLDVNKYLLTKAELDSGAMYPHKSVRIGCNVEGSYHPCEIMKKNNLSTRLADATFYSVGIRRWDGKGEPYGDINYNWPFKDEKAAVGNLSSAEIKFFAGPYSSDHHLAGTFRHSIGVPEVMLWPWKNNGTVSVEN